MNAKMKPTARAGAAGDGAQASNDTRKPTAPATPAQHSRRPDRYRLQVPPAWEVPGADAFRILDTHWGRK